MSNILLISAPGAGKGVSAKYLSDKYNLVHMSIGNLLRNEAKNDINIKQTLEIGGFIDNSIVCKLVNDFIEDNINSNFVFEGFPRMIEQVEPFESILSSHNLTVDKVIFINIDKDIAIKRISGRLMCKDCNEIYNKYLDDLNDMTCKKCGGELFIRDDDKLSTYENRYKSFIDKTMEVIEYYKNNYDFYEISNNESIEETYKQIDDIINK